MAWTISPPNSKLQLTIHNFTPLRTRPNSTLDLITLPRRRSPRLILTRSTTSDGGAIDSDRQPDTEAFSKRDVNLGDGYVGLFVRMLGIDNDPLDREQAIIALWKYSEGGKHCIDAIMQFHGCINLIVNLLKSDSNYTCEAAAGLLRTISSVNLYRDSVAESGAIEEIMCLLSRPFLTAEVKEQSICTLWNLSVDEKLRLKIPVTDLLPALIKFLDDEEIKVKEAAGGVLANLSLSHSNHKIMAESGLIQKLAELLKNTVEEGSKVTRKEAKNVLLELAEDEYCRILIIEEGLVLVPIIGISAYKSLRPISHSWPSLPDGTELERGSRPSRYGASELLLGLNIREKSVNLEEAKLNAIVGRTQQQFLARIGAIEMEEREKSQSKSSPNQKFTLLPWVDGIARLVLILGLEDASAVARAAQSIADASINEHMRTSFKEAGAVKHLVRLLGHTDESVRLAVAHALERLSVSYEVCQVMEAEGVVEPLVNILKHTKSETLMEKTVSILAQIFDPGKEMKSKFHNSPVNGSAMVLNGASKSAYGVTGLAITRDDISVLKAMTREKAFDLSVISCLVQILKTSSANLQRKTASILEYLAIVETCIETITAAGIESGLDAIFQQRFIGGLEENIDDMPEVIAIEAEEAGLAISAASRLLAKLLNFEQFHRTINSTHFILLLRKVLKSNVPLHAKEWVAACLVKLEFLAGSSTENPVEMEVALYKTIPGLIQQMSTSFSLEAREAAVIELNEIISEGVVDCTRAVAAQGGIFPLVKLLEEGSRSAAEASLAILQNLSMDSENHSAMIAAGVVPVLRRIVLAERPQWMRSLNLLRTLPT
ncbi:ARM repeat superfamily protein [Tasmannia lanceolata]|uniref:ARM repeat superfamily protein n=1 Tax=Tasmannia lanceolata TaxID=3420 RepID=UPI0040646605